MKLICLTTYGDHSSIVINTAHIIFVVPQYDAAGRFSHSYVQLVEGHHYEVNQTHHAILGDAQGR